MAMEQTIMNALNDSIFDDTSTDSLPRQQQQQQEPQDMGVLFQLIESREWEGVISFCNQVPDSASVGRVYAEDVLNLPLHEVARQPNPSLTVVNLLLQMYPEGISRRGYQGNFPLHYACSNENISVSIVLRLLEAYPTATRLRNDDDALPIHLACQHLTELDSIMAILQTHPEGAYLRDADGFTALDYAAGTDHKTTMEQMAPILVETAKAAADRKEQETHQKIKGIQEAHSEYIRQLSEREEDNTNEMIQAQIDLQDELSSEKERNIALAERILDKERRLQDLQIQVDQLTNLIKDERLNRQLEVAKQQKEYKEILGIQEDGPSSPRSLASATSSISPIRTTQNVDVKLHLSSLVEQYNLQRTQYAEMTKDLTYHTNMVRNLNELLTSKDEQIVELQQEHVSLQQAHGAQTESNQNLQATLQQTQDERLEALAEIQRLSTAYEQQSELLTESNRLVRVQESRLASIKSLAQSLSFNIESWALDDQQKEEEEEEEAQHWGRPSSQPSQPTIAETPQPNDLLTSPTDEDERVLEGMETIHGKRISPHKTEDHSFKTNEDSLKTSETGMSTQDASPGRTESSQIPISGMRPRGRDWSG